AFDADVHVEQHDVRLVETLPRLRERLRLEHLVADRLEVHTEEEPNRRLVVDDEHGALRRRAVRRHAAAASNRGSVVSRPSSPMLWKRPGAPLEPVTASLIGWNPCRGFRPSLSSTVRSSDSIASAVNGSRSASASRAAATTSPSPSTSASTSWKRNPA